MSTATMTIHDSSASGPIILMPSGGVSDARLAGVRAARVLQAEAGDDGDVEAVPSVLVELLVLVRERAARGGS